jgi:hypothetical protein
MIQWLRNVGTNVHSWFMSKFSDARLEKMATWAKSVMTEPMARGNWVNTISQLMRLIPVLAILVVAALGELFVIVYLFFGAMVTGMLWMLGMYLMEVLPAQIYAFAASELQARKMSAMTGNDIVTVRSNIKTAYARIVAKANRQDIVSVASALCGAIDDFDIWLKEQIEQFNTADNTAEYVQPTLATC